MNRCGECGAATKPDHPINFGATRICTVNALHDIYYTDDEDDYYYDEEAERRFEEEREERWRTREYELIIEKALEEA